MLNDHFVNFIIDALNGFDLSQASINHWGTGSAQDPPRMLLGLLIYGYATGRFSSREIERATHSDVAMRYLSGDLHPDHDTICTFRVKNEPLMKQTFTSILLLAKELKLLKVGNVSIDGTKVLANASKHKATSCVRRRWSPCLELSRRSWGLGALCYAVLGKRIWSGAQ